ncbi:MAG: 16S rRNA (cytidine(1402)-2'-O)-methyltransferase [Actinobacteria bacterium]|nr:16S rRNA (cytidine(1402)-2'-O)-methyltransferase [Actinomycetota bacterium]
MTGVLTLVSTPIGNLGDLAPRAVEALEAADLVCCEDTRRTGSLLKQIGVRVDELRRLDDHTEFESIPVILDRLVAGERVVLVSDAGTPGISDPGERLVAAVAEAGIEVTTVPGPVAAIAALVSSGLPSGRFVFEGFLARKGQERSAQLEAIAVESRTTVFYESPNRVAATLAALAEACGPDRRAVIARELTKLHEELRRGTLAELAVWASAGVKGPPPGGSRVGFARRCRRAGREHRRRKLRQPFADGNGRTRASTSGDRRPPRGRGHISR